MNTGSGNADGENAGRENAGRKNARPIAAAFVNAVQDRLGDLDPDELSDIVSDMNEHLEAVAAELGEGLSWETLTARLGTPAGYAAELRAAAGFVDPQVPRRRSGIVRRAVRFLAAVLAGSAVVCAGIGLAGVLFVGPEAMAWLVVSFSSSIAAVACILALVLGAADRGAELRGIPGSVHVLRAERWLRRQPWGEPALEYAWSLRPAWWALRAVAVGLVVGYASTVSLGVAVFLVAVVGSVWLGLRSARQPLSGGRRVALGVVNTVVIVAGAIAVASVADDATTPAVDYVSYQDDGVRNEVQPVDDAAHPMTTEYEAWRQGSDGPVSNVFPYGPDGELLTGVRLYDQDGRPIDVPSKQCDGDPSGQDFTVPSPWGANVYPRLSVSSDDGECMAPEFRPPFGQQLPDLEHTSSSEQDK